MFILEEMRIHIVQMLIIIVMEFLVQMQMEVIMKNYFVQTLLKEESLSLVILLGLIPFYFILLYLFYFISSVFFYFYLYFNSNNKKKKKNKKKKQKNYFSAHFHIPVPSRANLTLDDLFLMALNEVDYPQCSWATGSF